jgi:hypothetical protein
LFGHPVKEKDAEEKISPEMFERHDYLIFTFENEFDWKSACQAFGIEMVKSQSVGKKSIQQRGIGRVVSGKELLKKMVSNSGLSLSDT